MRAGDLREHKPLILGVAAAVLLLVAGVLMVRQVSTSDPVAELGSEVVVRFTDSGDVQTLNRGWFERQLMIQAGERQLTPETGLLNPKTGKFTGIPEDLEYWKQLVERVNTATAATRQRSGTSSGSSR
jgi:hypothetical protein